MTYPYTAPMLEVVQPLGTFCVAIVPARILLDCCYSERLKATKTDTGYRLAGSQRLLKSDRLRDIAEYLNSAEVSFPNTLILAANFRQEDASVEEREEIRWRIEAVDVTPPRLVIPGPEKNAVVVDGQHRLFSFSEAMKERLDMNLVCSVFLDLPRQYQAFLFATINSTQKPVDKSLTYELFGFNVEEEPPEAWSPDKLAVFLTRKLNTEDDSPFVGKVLVAAENDFALSRAEARAQQEWIISTATIVERITRLISANPKRDASALMTRRIGRNRDQLKNFSDSSPLRATYLHVNDKLIYTIVKNYFSAARAALFDSAKKESFIFRTVGVQALFDVLRLLVPESLQAKDISRKYFLDRLSSAATLDFAHEALRSASGAGRSRIRRFLEVAIGLSEASKLSEADQGLYLQVSG
jgi:DNA phosphorothioation-associated DGQHR protein 1